MDLFITANSVPDGQDDAIPAAGTPQFVTNGDPTSINKPPSVAPAYWFNSLARNIVAIIEGCGLVPNRNAVNQIWTALSGWFAPLVSPAFTVGLKAEYGPQDSFTLNLQADGTAVFYAGTTPIFSVTATGIVSDLTITSEGPIAAKASIGCDGAIAGGASFSLGGPQNTSYQWSGDDKSGYNPIFSHTTGSYLVNGGLFGYSVVAAAAYLGTSNVGGPIVNFYGQAGVIGSITLSTATSVAYNTQSDRRAKFNVQPLDGAIAADRVMLMRPVSHQWLADPDQAPIHGFLADEFQQVVPWGVTGKPGAVDDDGPVMQQMDAAKAIPDLTAALQHALHEIASLRRRLDELGA